MSEQEEIEAFKKILLKHNIKMDIWGCGCCGSPDITMEYEGEHVLCTSGEEIKMIDVKDE
jgi:hypothetical protein